MTNFKESIHYPLRKIQDYQLKNLGLGTNRLKIKNLTEANLLIKKLILNDNPIMISRFGSVEFYTMTTGRGFKELYNNAGFFPYRKEYIKEFQRIYYESSNDIDVLGIWIYKYTGTSHWIRKIKLINKLSNLSHIIPLHALNPYDNCWIESLEGKKVLVVHPFKESILVQYNKREAFDFLPEFSELEVVKAVQTIGNNVDNRFDTWFDALEFMKQEINNKNFDVCLLGCGAYGLPLAAYIKNTLGKKAIHIGGALQLLFGIKGRRWEVEYDFDFSNHWIYPLPEDKPDGYSKIENGCYWGE